MNRIRAGWLRSISNAGESSDRGFNVVDALIERKLDGQHEPASPPVPRSLRRGQHLYRAGDLSRHIYSVQRGTLKTYSIDAVHNEWITGFHSTGKLLGLDALVNLPMRNGAVALETTLVSQIPVRTILAGIEEFASLRARVLEQFYAEISRLESQMSQYSRNASQRIAHLVLHMAEDSNRIRLPMSHKEMGNYLHLSPETVSRVFARFQRHGWLDSHRREIKIRNRAALEFIDTGEDPGSEIGRQSAWR